MKKNILESKYLPSICSFAVIVVAWGLIGKFRWINPLFFPDLQSLSRALLVLLSGREVYFDAASTVLRAAFGLALSALVAVPLGLVLGRVPRVYAFLEFPIDFLRSVPSSALFFLFILFFGIGDASKVAVVFYGCSLIILINTIYGARATKEKQDRINMLRSFGATAPQILFLAVWRDALPHISAGLRVCVSLSLVLVVITEMFLSANNGLGRRIYDFYLAYNIPQMYAAIILLGVIGFAANRVAMWVERRTAFWTSINS